MSVNPLNNFFASTSRHLEPLLAEELRALGAENVRKVTSGVQFSGAMVVGYKACLWSRVANRILLPVGSGAAAAPEELYECVQSIDWDQHLGPDDTLAVDFFCAKSIITHSRYGAQKVKDAIVDQFREKYGRRPSVDRTAPGVRINVYLFRNRARIAIDLSGTSLHRRNYRTGETRAPLKENLAAALLKSAAWQKHSAEGGIFYDPMCGSGTFLIEAAMIATNTAPGLFREYYGFQGWKGFEPAIWSEISRDAQQLASVGTEKFLAQGGLVVGSDISGEAVTAAIDNIERAGFQELIKVSCSDIAALPDQSARPGLVLFNPPYGVRMQEQERLGSLYTAMGAALKRSFDNWYFAIFSGVPGLLFRTRLHYESLLELDNGGIACRLVSGQVNSGKMPVCLGSSNSGTGEHESHDGNAPSNPWENSRRPSSEPSSDPRLHLTDKSAGKNSEPPVAKQKDDNMFANRLRKNLRKLKGWIRQRELKAYRVYDADMPEYAVAIDVFDSNERHVVVQEYQAPSTVSEAKAAERLNLVLATIPDVLGCTKEAVHLKVRKKQKGSSQYVRESRHRVEHVLLEDDCRYLLNFEDYIDVGVFPDHRKIRQYIKENSKGSRFLNLFGYTGVATIYAGVGGARSTITVDMSNTYIEWTLRNLALNALGTQDHHVERADCTLWIKEQEGEELFDLILLDPPTFSNSANMDKDWDVQAHHSEMIHNVMKLLSVDGVLIFSNNSRRFGLDESLPRVYAVEDRSAWSTDKDFERGKRARHCWFIRHFGAS